MSDYMASLAKLAKRNETVYFPPRSRDQRRFALFVNYYILHRRAREDSILHRPRQGTDRHSDHRARDLYRHRPAPDRAAGLSCWRIWKIWWCAAWWRRRSVTGDRWCFPPARVILKGGNRIFGQDHAQQNLSSSFGLPLFRRGAFVTGSGRGTGAELTASSNVLEQGRTRAALAPKSWLPHARPSADRRANPRRPGLTRITTSSRIP